MYIESEAEKLLWWGGAAPGTLLCMLSEPLKTGAHGAMGQRSQNPIVQEYERDRPHCIR